MSEARGDAQQALEAVADRLRRLDAELKGAEPAQGTPFESELLSLHEELEEFGLLQLLTAAESVPIAPDNLPDALSDEAGIAAIRATLRTLAKLASSRATLGPTDWEGSQWDVVVVRRGENAPSDEFCRVLCFELDNQWNLAAFYAPERITPEDQDGYPPAGVTATNDPAFRKWTLSWGGALLWWEEAVEGLRMRLENAFVQGELEEFDYSATSAAGRRAAALIAEGLPYLDRSAEEARAELITIEEHRALEATLRVVVDEAETVSLSAEDRAQLDVLIEMLQLQLRAPRPDRPIIGRVLRGLATVGGGVLLGTAGNYLSDLLRSFGVPWP